MMRGKLSWRGFCWKDRFGSVVRHPWRTLAPLVLTPLLFALLLVFSLNRSLNFAWMLRQSPTEAAELYAEFSRTSVENLLAVQPPPHTSDLPTLQLYVPKNSMQAMHSASVTGDIQLGHEPGGDRPYFRAYFRDESGRLQKSKVCYRGLMHYHHWPEKPSLRIKIKKADIALGQRYVELSRPKDMLALRNQIPEVLARELQIVSTLNEQVRLFINNKYFGVYLRSYRAGEALALANGRMPGTFFKGDLVGPRDPDERLNLWETREHWKVFGEATEADAAFFDDFLTTLRLPPTTESITRLAELLDTECLARWSAIMIVTGSVHTDARHNQTYFYCSNQGKLEIMPWDPTLYEVAGRAFIPVNTINHPVLDRMSRDPRWVHRRNHIIHELITGPASAAAMQQHVDQTLARILPDLRADIHISKKATIGRGRVPSSIWDIDEEVEIIKRWAVAKEQFLKAYLDDAQLFVVPNPDRPGESLVYVDGHAALRVTRQDGSRQETTDDNGGAVQLLYPGLSAVLQQATFQPHDLAKQLPYAASVPLVYQIAARSDDLVFHNAITGARVTPETSSPPESRSARTLPPSTFPVEPTGEIVLGPGDVVLTSNLHVGRRQTLVIRPGTTIRLLPNVGIYSRGQVSAVGTPNAPILIEAAGEKPWAAFGLSGNATRGSRFEYVSVAGGSVGSDLGIRFKGMFNVYGCPALVIRHCRFGRNHVGDDAVNLAESNIRVEQCHFADARADALDLDMCVGSVSQCRWRNSGNDGLDMMHCQVRVEDCVFETSGDKGISVGEGSQVLVRNCHIERCAIGIEVKDASRVVVIDTKFDANRVGYHSYRKKWLYPAGGSGLLIDCKFRESRETTIGIEAKSKLWLLRTPVDSVKAGARRIHRVDVIEPNWKQLIDELEAL